MIDTARLLDTIQFAFPYRDFWATPKLAVTPWLISIVVTYFSISTMYLFFRLRRLGARLESYVKKFSLERIRNDSLLREFWWKYEQSFLPLEGDVHKAEADAADFFDGYGVLAKQVNIRYWNTVQGTLLGLGLFGTFLGLALGTSTFDTSKAESIRSSIQVLLSGMGTAFLASLWGLGCSILFNIFERTHFNRITRKLPNFCHALDQRFRLSKAERIRIDQESRKRAKLAELRLESEERERFVKDLFVTDTGGKEVLPGYVLRGLLTYASQQTAAMKSLADLFEGHVRVEREAGNLRDRVKVTVEETRNAGVTEDELDEFLGAVVREAQAPQTDRGAGPAVRGTHA